MGFPCHCKSKRVSWRCAAVMVQSKGPLKFNQPACLVGLSVSLSLSLSLSLPRSLSLSLLTLTLCLSLSLSLYIYIYIYVQKVEARLSTATATANYMILEPTRTAKLAEGAVFRA